MGDDARRSGDAGPPAGSADEWERRTGGETLPAAAFVVAIAAIAGFVVSYVDDADTQKLGVFAFLALAGIGTGMVLWAKRYMTPGHPEIEPRGRLGSTEAEVEAFHADFELGEYELERRGLLTKLLVGALGATGLGALVPLLSLGPDPDTTFKVTPWSRGKRLVDIAGNPLRPDDVNEDGVITVFPDGAVGDELAQTLLIGIQPGKFRPVAGRESWTVGNVAAFSKVCTHAGCPVGLYQAAQGLLLCPCHQSTFDVNNGCQPVFGPAATPLPQLPLGLDGDGFLVAEGDLSAPPGPGFWDQRSA